MPQISSREIAVTGATGLVGGRLVSSLEESFDVIRILTRRERQDSGGEGSRATRRFFVWDGIDPGTDALRGATTVVHLSGEPIFGGLPSSERKKRIERSRVESTRAIVDRMIAPEGSTEAGATERPRTFVCASAVGYYGNRGSEQLDEDSKPGSGFLADVCRKWEAEAQRAASAGIRVVCVRIAVVISREGGALAMMRLPFSLGLGGRLGDGQQFFPWIHLDDVVGVIRWAIDSDFEGPVNAVAPEAIRNIDLTRALGRVLGRPTILPLPGFAIRAGLGVLADELLGSRFVRPKRLEEAGFDFRYPTLESALDAEFG